MKLSTTFATYRSTWADHNEPERQATCNVTIERIGAITDQQATEMLLQLAEQLSGLEFVRKE
jgi:hypothetical protein